MSHRVIHILHHSPSVVHRAPLSELLFKWAWHLETAYQQQTFIPGLAVECWTPERSLKRPLQTELRGVPQRWFPSYGLGYLRELSPGILSELKRLVGQPLDIFLHGSVSYFSWLLMHRFGDTFRIFVQNHGERPTRFMYAQGRKKPIDSSLRERLEPMAFQRARRILCLSPDNLEEYVSCGVSRERLLVSTMGVDLAAFYPSRAEGKGARHDLGIAEEACCIGFVGRLADEKRVDLLLGALKSLSQGHVLVLVGDGPRGPALKKQAADQGNAGRVHFAGHVSDQAQLRRFYNMFDLLVLPSLREGFPMALVEALACGTPTLATDLSGPRMLMEGFECGQFFEGSSAEALSHAIRAAVAKPYRAEKLVARAQDFSWQRVCETHQALLGEM